MNRDQIAKARLIANPGCCPTAVQLGFLPLIEAGTVDNSHLIADAKSGVSGAGRKAEVHILFSEASDNFKAYAVPWHRYLPGISQGLSCAAGKKVGLTFVPHLTPAICGIHATLYARLIREADLRSTKNATEPNHLSMSCPRTVIPIRARLGAPTIAESQCIAWLGATRW